jgi:prepilin peptidase CpaA
MPYKSISMWLPLTMVALATISDLRSRRIPNTLTLPSLLLGVAVGGVSKGWSGVADSLLGVLAAVTVMGLLYYLGGMGMGDVKLCAAIGAWVGPSQMAVVLVMTSIAGGVIGLCWAVAGGFFLQTARGMGTLLAGFAKEGLKPHETLVLDNALTRKMPYAPAIAIGTVCSFLGRH